MSKTTFKDVVAAGREAKDTAVEAASEVVSDVQEGIQTAVEEGKERAETYVKRHPWTAISLTAAVALLAGMVLRGAGPKANGRGRGK